MVLQEGAGELWAVCCACVCVCRVVGGRVLCAWGQSVRPSVVSRLRSIPNMYLVATPFQRTHTAAARVRRAKGLRKARAWASRCGSSSGVRR